MDSPLKTKLQGMEQAARNTYISRLYEEGIKTEFAQLLELIIDQCRDDTVGTIYFQHGRDGAANCVLLSGELKGIEQVRARLFPHAEQEIEETKYE